MEENLFLEKKYLLLQIRFYEEYLPLTHRVAILLLASFSILSNHAITSYTLQISIGWLYVVTSVIPLALKRILPIHIIPIGKIL